MAATMVPGERNSVPGVRTRQKLIEAGVEIFGRYNFEATTTRMLADRAGVNLAAIPYHFKSKEGLYHAVVRHIVEQATAAYGPAVAEINETLAKSSCSSSECFAMLSRILNTMVSTILGTPEAKSWAGIILREQIEPTKAFDIFYEGVMQPVLQSCLALVARILHRQPDDPETMLSVLAIVGQVLIFRTSREAVIRSLKWRGYSRKEIQVVQSNVIKHACAILGVPVPCESPSHEGGRRDE
jgi:TetR/AcrR family transcriptional regulator, regulator of cefoperazone and chloramphenicol sensitivity